MKNLEDLWKDLQRRNVIKATVSYLVVAWLILQVVSVVLPIFSIGSEVQRWIFILLAIGFPCWVIFAYIYERTPTGYKPTDEVAEEKSISKSTSRRLNRVIIAGLSLAVVLLVLERIFPVSELVSAEGNSSEMTSIAVLPFENQSPDQENEFFTEGVHEDVMTKLAGLNDLTIISKTTIRKYKNYEGDLKDLGRKLDVSYVMEGAVRRFNNQVRITATLIDVATDQSVWSHEYDGELESIFELQSEIATKIASSLQTSISSSEQENLNEVPTPVLDAYDDYLKGRFILNQIKFNYDETLEAIRLLENAVKADDQFYKAWALLGRAWVERYFKVASLDEREEEKELAKTEARKALDKAKGINPQAIEVFREEGFFQANVLGDRIGALKTLDKALAINPYDLETIMSESMILFYMGEMEKIIENTERALKVNPDNWQVTYSLSMAYEAKREYKKMVPYLEKLYQMNPDQKHYLVEAKYYQFLNDGKISSYEDFRNAVEITESSDPFDERAIQNKEMVVALFEDQFMEYKTSWLGKWESHTRGHGEWMCPMVANENLNHAKLLIDHRDHEPANHILDQVSRTRLKPINENSVCVFDANVYLPKLDFLIGEDELAKTNLKAITPMVLANDRYPRGAVEKAVLLEATDLIDPQNVYEIYKRISSESVTFYVSFENICANPWTYPNLIKTPEFVREIKEDGRFVAFLTKYGFLS